MFENMFEVMFWNEACEAVPFIYDAETMTPAYFRLYSPSLEDAESLIKSLAEEMYAKGAVDATIHDDAGRYVETITFSE